MLINTQLQFLITKTYRNYCNEKLRKYGVKKGRDYTEKVFFASFNFEYKISSILFLVTIQKEP